METLKGLIIKDFETVKSYKSTVIYILVLYTVTSFFNNQIITFIPVFMPLCFGMLGISSFSYDTLSKSDKYILTFPINKKEVVKARYIYILLLTLSGSLLGLVLVLALQLVKLKGFIPLEMVTNILATLYGGLVGIMFIQAFQIPVMYKFGAEKGRIIQMTMIVILMLGVSISTTTLMKFFEISLTDFIVMLKDYLIAIIGIIVVFLYILSYIISCKIYQDKEI